MWWTEKRVRLFIDDIVCFSENGAEHVRDLESLFERLTMFDMTLAPKKVHLGVHIIKVLGYCVTVKGVEPDPGQVEAMTKLPMPCPPMSVNYDSVRSADILPEIFATEGNRYATTEP